MALIKCKECGNEISSEAKSCPKCGAPAPKKTKLLTWIIGGIFAFFIFSAIFSTDKKTPTPSPASPAQTTAATRTMDEAARAVCKSEIESRKSKYAELMTAGKFESAAQAMGDCPNLLNDPALKEMVDSAEKRHYIEIVTNEKRTPADRLWALDVLRQHYPEKAKGYEKLHAQLQARRDQAEKAARRKADASTAGGLANPAHAQIMRMSDLERNSFLTKVLRTSSENCDVVVRNFYQGAARNGNAFWNAGCRNEQAYVIQVNNDSVGSTRIISCAVLKMTNAGECFKRF